MGFARFFYPDIVEIDGCIILKHRFSKKLYKEWKKECDSEKTCIEKMMNLYQLKDFFHLNTQDDGNLEDQVKALGDVLKLFWSMSLKDRFPDRVFNIKVFDDNGNLFITIFEDI